MTDPTPPAEAVEIATQAYSECEAPWSQFPRWMRVNRAIMMRTALTALLRAGWKLEPPGHA